MKEIKNPRIFSKLSGAQKRIVSEYLSNIAVGWFIAGVIGIFIGKVINTKEILISLSWGIVFSLVFLQSALFFLKGVKEKE